MLELLNSSPAYLIACSLLLGLVIGSFLNVVIYRLPIMMQNDFQAQSIEYLSSLDNSPLNEGSTATKDPNTDTFNLIKPDSSCPHCGHKIRAYENIPVLSYLMLGGKCSACKAPISARYPMVEILTGFMSALLAWHFGFSWQLAFSLIFTYALIAQAFIDLDTQYLLDDISFPLLWLGLLANTQNLFTSLENAVLGAIIGYLSLWTIFWVYKLLTGKEGLGYGDFKLMALLGAWMGWQYLPLVILLSSVTGSVLGSIQIYMSKHSNKDIPISFGPYLASAGWIAFLWGENILEQYMGFLSL